MDQVIDLPKFKYHPDPIATGSFQANQTICASCGELRPYSYVGSVYAEADLENLICPWCISDGQAHDKFGVEFTDIDAVGGFDSSAPVPIEVKEEIAFRTPGFNGWQHEHWLVHCADACAFLGPAGRTELEIINSQELNDSIRADANLDSEEFPGYFEKLNKEKGPTAYIFRCLHCGTYLGYSDFF